MLVYYRKADISRRGTILLIRRRKLVGKVVPTCSPEHRRVTWNVASVLKPGPLAVEKLHPKASLGFSVVQNEAAIFRDSCALACCRSFNTEANVNRPRLESRS